MHELLKILTQRMEHDLKKAIQRRYDILMSGIKFESERIGSFYNLAVEKGWNQKRIEILCCLNAFYQIVLGPLASAARPNVSSGLISKHPIAYGSKIVFNNDESAIISECHTRFSNIMKYHGIDFRLVQANHAQDLLYLLANPRNLNG